MSVYAESYDVEESSFEDFDSADELSLPSFLRPGKKVSVPGSGLLSATLNTPKGPAKLSLPTPVPTHTQFRQLESALNAQTQRLNAVQAELARLRRRQPQGSSGMMSMLMPLLMHKKLKEDFLEHTHSANNTKPTVPAASNDPLTSLLPLLMLAPGMLGGSSTATSSSKESDLFSNPLVLMMLFDAL